MMQPGSHIIGNRKSTPDASGVGSGSSLRPPAARSGMGHHLRASADMSGAFSAAPMSSRGIRPASEIFYNPLHGQNLEVQDDNGGEGAQWIADLNQYENTLEEMASATMDKDFKDELVAIEQWFKVLSEAERTAALYALLQQTTQVQIRFFIGVLQQMAKNHPMSGVLSPANFGERDAMSNRFNTAMSRLSMDGSRATVGSGRPIPSTNNARHSGLGQSDINSMFPDAAAAIAQHRAELSQQSGPPSNTNRHSMHFGDRSSLITPTITTPLNEQSRESFQPPASPWQRSTDAGLTRPRSSMGTHQPMGQFSQSVSSSMRPPRPMTISGDNILQNTSLNALEHSSMGASIISPYAPGASWASMSNTPMVANFSNQQSGAQADMVANATAMKLAALSTVNNRIQLDDVRKYRRARSSDGQQTGLQASMSALTGGAGLPANFIMTNELGQVLSPQQAAILQAQQLAAIGNRRSRPSSPALTVPGSGLGGMNFGGTHHNGYLSAYDSSSQLLNGMSGMPGMNLGAYGLNGSEGYMSDASEINRGRSPRGRRGSSRPPEDPTDVALLKDIPNWLRSLRLHKYTDNLKDMDWRDLVKLDDAGLEAKGVNALGARRKMLKVFEDVLEKQAQGKL